MGIPSTRNVVLLFILFGGIITLKIDPVFGQGPSKSEEDSVCWDTANFAAYCYSSMEGHTKKFQMPSKQCCAYAQKINFVQFCNKFVVQNEQIYNAAKVADVAKHCKKPLRKGTKCGSHTAP
ncbi:hypothetical protein ABFX02_02G113700 [Erythranthe guttata]